MIADYSENDSNLPLNDSSGGQVYVGEQHRRRKRRLLWKNTSLGDSEIENASTWNQSRYDEINFFQIYIDLCWFLILDVSNLVLVSSIKFNTE